jgi:hypothetical protein
MEMSVHHTLTFVSMQSLEVRYYEDYYCLMGCDAV